MSWLDFLKDEMFKEEPIETTVVPFDSGFKSLRLVGAVRGEWSQGMSSSCEFKGTASALRGLKIVQLADMLEIRAENGSVSVAIKSEELVRAQTEESASLWIQGISAKDFYGSAKNEAELKIEGKIGQAMLLADGGEIVADISECEQGRLEARHGAAAALKFSGRWGFVVADDSSEVKLEAHCHGIAIEAQDQSAVEALGECEVARLRVNDGNIEARMVFGQVDGAIGEQDGTIELKGTAQSVEFAKCDPDDVNVDALVCQKFTCNGEAPQKSWRNCALANLGEEIEEVAAPGRTGFKF